MKKSGSLIGGMLMLVGVVVIVLKSLFGIRLLDFTTSDFWVFIVLLVGLSFELSYFIAGSKPGLLIPGGIITTIALLFMFEVSTNWNFSEYTWPGYIFSVAVGLFQMYLFSKREKGLLIASAIIAGVSAFFSAMMMLQGMLSFLSSSIFIPIALILAGAIIIISSMYKKANY